jgi:hypothetical protein
VKFGVDKVFYVSGLKNLVCWIFHFLWLFGSSKHWISPNHRRKFWHVSYSHFNQLDFILHGMKQSLRSSKV